ncbi:MAG TPA: STAS domain-containing protein [Gaiellaceae bacterium]|nr:STAS domain-containing protein [Gaiellaceae bacterium]
MTLAQDSGVSVLRLYGENNSLLAWRLRSELATAVAGSTPVVVDLSGATSIDAAVIRILLEGLAESEKHEQVLLLLLPDDTSSPVRQLFQMTGLAGLLPVVSSWDEALRRAGRASAA